MRKKMLLVVMAAIVASVITIGVPASAALFDGKVVNYQYFYPDGKTPFTENAANGNYTVGAGIEVSNFVKNRGTLDISDTNIVIDFNSSACFNNYHAFNGFRIQDVNDTIDDFTSVVINPLTNLTGFDSSMITFDANNIWVNWGGIVYTEDTFISLNIKGLSNVNRSPSVNGGAAPVPEPTTMLLLGIGLVGLTAFSRRKFKKN